MTTLPEIMSSVARVSGDGIHSNLDLPGLMEAGEMHEPGQEFRCHEAEFGRTRRVPAGHDENRTFDRANLAIAGQGFWQQSSQLLCPGLLVGRLTQ